MLKRNETRNYNPSKWELPGGKIGEKEDIERALDRIMNKECGLFVKFVPDKYYVHSRIVNEPGKYEGYSYFEIVVPAIYLAGSINIINSEHSDYKWVKLCEALKLDLSFETRKNLTKYISENTIKTSDLSVIVVSRSLIMNSKKEVLIVKRSNKVSYPDEWELPGGKLTSFESLTDHLVREVLEETGLVVRIASPHVYVHSFIPSEGVNKGRTFINIINISKVKSGKIRLSNEHSEYAWIKQSEIFQYRMPDYMNLSVTELFGKVDLE